MRPLSRTTDESGVALVTALLALLLVSGLMAGVFAAINSDQRSNSIDFDQTQAYAAAHAGLEKLTSDLTSLFIADVSPSVAQINVLESNWPKIGGFLFRQPGGVDGSGYRVTFADANNDSIPDAIPDADITAGPYEGFKGLITPYDITVTARSAGGAEVRLRRTLQTVAVPVFQFGMFSETDLAFHSGDGFTFGGRVHTNGNLFLAQGDGSTLTMGDRITALGEVIRTHLPNGLVTTDGYDGTVNIYKGSGGYAKMARNQGSLKGTLGVGCRGQGLDPSCENKNWMSLSTTTFKSYILNWKSGAKRLALPITADADGDGVGDAEPIEVIRRPNPATPDTPLIAGQRFYTMASLRILLSDTAADIMTLPGIVAGQQPINLVPGAAGYAPGLARPPFAAAADPVAAGPAPGNLPANVYKSPTSTPLLNGFLKIELQRANGTWQDVTLEILNFGFAGRSLADRNQAEATRWNNLPDSGSAAENCEDPNPNAIIRLQRVRDVPLNSGLNAFGACAYAGAWPVVTNVSQSSIDYWPMALYDTREGQMRDGLKAGDIYLGGIMHYVELDVNNLRRWFANTAPLGGNGNLARVENGFIVYFSDRRNNRNDAATPVETGEYGYEDTVNPPNMTVANGLLDAGEDANSNGVLDQYGRVALYNAGFAAPYDAGARPLTRVPSGGGNPSAALVARANRPVHFRRALKIVNGARGNLPMPGLTIASENPVYVQGNYNATATDVATDASAAAIIADAVTLLSNNWNDIRSFISPQESKNVREAATTGYRVAIISGKTIPFPKPTWADASFGSDGGAHNFVRLLEDWNEPNATLWYRGSFVSLYFSRQGTGSFKCCETDAYVRGRREWTFDDNFLTPSLLPPGTPMFRDVNTLTFRQILRPNQ